MDEACRTKWGEIEVELTFHKDDLPDLPATSVHCFVFNDKGEILVIEHESRGLDIPGGHTENGETPLETLQREIMEEASVTGCNFRKIGYVRVENIGTHTGSKYPPVAKMPFYVCDIETEHNFSGEMETNARLYIAPETLAEHWPSWNAATKQAFERAITLRTTDTPRPQNTDFKPF